MKSIRTHLTRSLWLAFGLLLLAGGLVTFGVTRQVLTAQFDATVLAKAQALATAAEVDDGTFDIDLSVQDFAGFGRHRGSDAFEVRRKDGTLLERSPGLRQRPLPRVPPPRSAEPEFHSVILADGRPARLLVQHFVPEDSRRRYDDLHLIVASESTALQRQLRVLAIVLVATLAAALALTGPLVRLTLRRGLRPLDQLARHVQQLGAEKLDQRLAEPSLPRELRGIAGRLNELLARLEASFERERRFSSHAAHELRTPLAELRTLAEIGATWPEEATPERCREMVSVTDELTSLLEKLTLLARADSGRQPVQRERIRPAELLGGVRARLEPAIASRHLRLAAEVEAETLETDPVLYAAILQNLLGNAVAHSPPGSTIVARIAPRSLEVSNPAPDLTPEDLPHLSERFWRKDRSRSQREHSGLGLSIVHACASLLGGELTTGLSADGIFRVAVRWNSSYPDSP